MQESEPYSDAQGNETLHGLPWAMQESEPYSIHAWLRHTLMLDRPRINVTVAALDSGLSRDAVDVFEHVQEGYDFVSDTSISNDGDGRDGDWIDPGDADRHQDPVDGRSVGCSSTSSWHGTLTASLLACDAGKVPPGTSFRGAAPIGTRLMPVRVLGRCVTGYASDVADAIVWAVGGEIRGMQHLPADRAAHVILMPFAGYTGPVGCPSYLQSAVDLAIQRNATLIAAAGNHNHGSASDYVPGSCRGVISVGALNRSGRFTQYTNMDADLYLPGGDEENPLLCMSAGKMLVPCTGTSFSAAFAAAWAAHAIARQGYFSTSQRHANASLADSNNASATMQPLAVHGQLTFPADCYSWGGTTVYPFAINRFANNAGSKFWSHWEGSHNTGQWFGCASNACMYGRRNWIELGTGWQDSSGNQWYMDEFCVCMGGYHASSARFDNYPWGYVNSDARPSNAYCPGQPAAYDEITCSACADGSYCKGEAEWTERYCTTVPCTCESSAFMMHTPQRACTACVAGKYVTENNNCGTTQNRQYNRKCAECILGSSFSTNTNALSCTACVTNCGTGSFISQACTQTSQTVCTTCTKCGAGKYRTAACNGVLNTQVCTDCIRGTYSTTEGATSAATCQQCTPGKYSDVVGATEASTCKSCTAGKYSFGGAPGCTDCSSGLVSTSDGSGSCTACGLGRRASSASTCTDCLPGTFWGSATTGTIACSTCLAGTYSGRAASSCIPCSTTQVSDTARTACITCAAGKLANQATQACMDCEAGTASSVSSETACGACQPGSYSGVGWSSCRQCTPGSYSDAVKSIGCKNCPAGTFSPRNGSNSSSNCQTCPHGKYSSGGMSSCITCANDLQLLQGRTGCYGACERGLVPAWAVSRAGNESTDTGCVKCSDLGRYFENSSAPGYCVPCRECVQGQEYASVLCTSYNDAECPKCDVCTQGVSFYRVNCTLSTPASCSPCRPTCDVGFYEAGPCTLYSDADCRQCTDMCPEGEYKSSPCNSTHDAACDACPVCGPGKYVSRSCSTSHARECLDCPMGTYTDAPNRASCAPCMPGTYAPYAGMDACLRCSAGTYISGSNATSCEACGEGKYNIVSGVSSCATCPAATYLSNASTGECSLCPAGSFSPAEGMARCTVCQEGTYSPQPNGSSNNTRCLPCGPGTFSPSTGSASCEQCPRGTRSERRDGSTACVQCSAGSFASEPGQSACSACSPACTLGLAYTETDCTASTDRRCSPCRREACPLNQTSNVSWCLPSGAFACTACPEPGNDAVHLLPEYSCKTCSGKGCGGTPGTYQASTCPVPSPQGDDATSTYACGRCRGCMYRQRVNSWAFCDGSGYATYDLQPDNEVHCSPCATYCQPGQYVANLCNGRTMHNTETCANCTSCPHGSYHARRLYGSVYPEFDGDEWRRGYSEDPCNGRGVLKSDGVADCERCDACPAGKYASDVGRCTGNGIWKDNFTCTACRPCSPGHEHVSPCDGLSFSDACRPCPACAAGFHATSYWNATSNRMVCACKRCLDAPGDVCPTHYYKTNRTCSGNATYDEASVVFVRGMFERGV